jgi:plastocyanin
MSTDVATRTRAPNRLRVIGRSAAAAVATALLLAGCGMAESAGHSGSAGHAAGHLPTQPAASTVVTKLLAFGPEKLTVPVGTTVNWRSGDGISHTVTTGTFTLGGDGLRGDENPDGRIDLPLDRGHEVSFTFDQPGTYTYFCSIHKGMDGVVEVTP